MLRCWGKLPEWERDVPGYLLRDLREQSGLTQVQLAQRLGTSQQAVSSAERWNANPTLRLVFAWQRVCNSPVGLAGKRPRGSQKHHAAKDSIRSIW
ncbi:MAG: helix-turn-helix transcriptional regulator [Acidobacteriota bacterium]